jgi:GTPase SAR1 family protein
MKDILKWWKLVAPGGVGKTALVKRWLDRLKADHRHKLVTMFAGS